MHLKVVLLFTLITVNNSENKFGDSTKSISGSNNSQNQGNVDHSDLIKAQIKKYMSECGADVSEESSSESKNYNRNSTSPSNNNFNNNHYGGSSNNNRNQNRKHGAADWGSSGSNSNPGYSTYGGYNPGQAYSGYDSSRDQNTGDVMRTNYGNWGGNYDGSSHGGNGMRGGYNQSSNNNYRSYGYRRESDSYGNNNGRRTDGYDSGTYSSSSGSGRDGYGYRGSYLRTKRADDDIECISQCVFGYLEVLDDNRSPSESAMIKWLQDHMPNDGKRIKALRETRRCFARLAASDNDDGCDFSKALSKCLNLEIEG